MSIYASDVSATPNNVYKSNLNHGQKYKDLAAANPYANPVYRESGWQKFLSSLGFRTDKDRYLEGMSIQAAEYDQALLEKEYNEQYDNPLAQAERERAAGLNPNLTGNVDPGSSSPMEDDGNPPQPSESDFGQVSEFASNVLNVVQTAYGLFNAGIDSFSHLQDVKSKGIANRIASMEENEKLFNFAEDAVVRLKPSVKDFESSDEVFNMYNELKDTYGKYMSKKQFKRFIHYATDFQNKINVDDKYYQKLVNRVKNRNEYWRTYGNSAQYSEDDVVMFVLSEELTNLATKVNKRKLENEKFKEDNLTPEQISNQFEYEKGRMPTAEARADLLSKQGNARSANLNADMLDYKKLLRSSTNDIFKRLETLSNEGNSFATIVKMLLSMLVLKNLGD